MERKQVFFFFLVPLPLGFISCNIFPSSMPGIGVIGKMTSLPAGMMINAEENRAMFFIKLSIFLLLLLCVCVCVCCYEVFFEQCKFSNSNWSFFERYFCPFFWILVCVKTPLFSFSIYYLCCCLGKNNGDDDIIDIIVSLLFSRARRFAVSSSSFSRSMSSSSFPSFVISGGERRRRR